MFGNLQVNKKILMCTNEKWMWHVFMWLVYLQFIQHIIKQSITELQNLFEKAWFSIYVCEMCPLSEQISQKSQKN